jgi:hypothetical protein
MRHIRVDVDLDDAMEAKLQAYRDRRRFERNGKRIHNSTAIRELVALALAGEDTSQSFPSVMERLVALERKVKALEEK